MFGYVTINSNELKEGEAGRYRAYYCGLCRSLHKSYGRVGHVTLTYDMTFLVILLNSLYEKELSLVSSRCIVHPAGRHDMLCGVFSEYAADMNIMLSYYNLLDDWRDERRVLKKAAAMLLSGRMKQLAVKYPRQNAALERYMRELLQIESSEEDDLEKAALLTGELLAEIFVFEEDVWARLLRRMGMYLGKFIYLMDAFEDVDRDIAGGSYNPLKGIRDREDFPDLCRDILMMQMAECCRAFEQLPLELDVGLLRNILYSGVWVRFAAKYNKMHENEEDT